MNSFPYIDIHTHQQYKDANTITVQNIFPGDGFAAFNGRNFYSVGLHPWHIGSKQKNNEALQMVEEALEFDHIIFVGETGLDKINGGDFIEQLRVFEAQAVIAEEYEYPLIIHGVKALNEIIALRTKLNPAMPWILHGYNSGLEITKLLIDKGFLFSFGKNLFHKNSKAVKSFKFLPLNKLFFETDELDLNVDVIYEQAAIIKDTTVEALKEAVWTNFNQIENSLMPGII